MTLAFALPKGILAVQSLWRSGFQVDHVPVGFDVVVDQIAHPRGYGLTITLWRAVVEAYGKRDDDTVLPSGDSIGNAVAREALSTVRKSSGK